MNNHTKIKCPLGYSICASNLPLAQRAFDNLCHEWMTCKFGCNKNILLTNKERGNE